MSYSFTWIDSPVGRLKLVASGKGLAAILWEEDNPKRVRLEPLTEASRAALPPVLQATARQLEEYFAGKRKAFSLAFDPVGTPFQRRVWEALSEIPFGEIRSYGEIAARIGRPTASRAVGAANGRNPLSIVVPCHRVIGASGKLTGFAGGLRNKEILLSLEGRTLL
ncbi:methylated-DNA-[protein]-cysteine S-methyltransferase [Verrucomicrobium sp. GAS474]|uniref:methylated-DNA--[protein]-cysteine S-methyltransferase n=1 Tax=Verrucomicrobium sp. GAS474 TaxID=1882831 RepID=UPI000879AE29|nr:methylated-DNA--[protein]-cysteine S-methyltransferase [Verrucomicrobium sp. GAS474]SDT89464.1 methylated-DNA-[protein]-cysteine S-methyltransferase [Verrucomicrobium sp. GAS474]